MKKKLALLLAAVMTLSAIPAMSLSAASSTGVPFQYSGSPKKTLFPGYSTPNKGKYSFTTTQGDNAVEYVGGGFAYDVTSGSGSNDTIEKGWTFTLQLTNAKFDFSETNSIGYDFGGSTATYQKWVDVTTKKTESPSWRAAAVADYALYETGWDTGGTPAPVASETEMLAFAKWLEHYVGYDLVDGGNQPLATKQYYTKDVAGVAGYKPPVDGKYTWYLADGTTEVYTVQASGSSAKVTIENDFHDRSIRVWLPVYMETESHATIRVSGQTPSFIPSAAKDVHTVDSSTAGVTVSFGDVKQGRDKVEIDTITITETSMVLTENGWLKLSLPSGYVFENEVPTVDVIFGGDGLKDYGFNSDYDELYIKIGNFRTIGDAVSIELGNIVVSPDDDTADSNYYGTKVKLTVEGTKSYYKGDTKYSGVSLNVDKASAVVVEFVDYGVSLDFVESSAKVTESFSGKAGIEAGLDDDDPAEMIFEERATGTWSAERNLEITLTDKDGAVLDGVKFNTFEITDFEELTGISTDTYAFKADTDDNVDFGRKKITVKSDAIIKSGEKGSLSFKVTFNAAANFTGDVYLTVGGRAVSNDAQSKKVATIVAPFTVKTSKTVVPVGISSYPVANIVITENAPEALARGNDLDIMIREYANQKETTSFDIIRFNSIDKNDVTVTAGDLTIKDVDYSRRSLNISINKASTEESKIEISNLSVGTLSNAPQGDFPLVIGGDSWVETYWIQDEDATGDYVNLKKTWGNLGSKDDDYGLFDVEGLVVEKYVEISTSLTANDTTFNKNVRVLIGTTTVIVDGVEQEMPAKSYIDPESNRTLLPLRAVAVAFGLTNDQIVWDPDARTATVLAGSKIITFTIGSHIMMINGVAMPMVDDAGNISKAVINPENDRTYLPMRYLGLAFGVEAIYIEGNPSEAIFNPTDEQIEASKVVKPAVDEVADDEVADDEVADETADETAADTETPAAE